MRWNGKRSKYALRGFFLRKRTLSCIAKKLSSRRIAVIVYIGLQ